MGSIFVTGGSSSLKESEARLAMAILSGALGRAPGADGFTLATDLPGPDQVIVLDSPAPAPGSRLIIDSARPAAILWEALGRPAGGVVAVDATGIAEEEGSDPVVALLGAVARSTPTLDPEALAAAVWAAYDRGFGYMARAALKTFDLGYRQAQVKQ